jgi:hypothetical protein
MTKEMNCAGCGASAVHTKTVPLCGRCGLAVAEEALGFIFAGVRGGATVIELPAPESKMSTEEANDVTYQHLVALRRKGVKQVTASDFKEIMTATGRSRPWLYRWLDARVDDRELAKTKTADGVTYTFTY